MRYLDSLTQYASNRKFLRVVLSAQPICAAEHVYLVENAGLRSSTLQWAKCVTEALCTLDGEADKATAPATASQSFAQLTRKGPPFVLQSNSFA